MVLTRLFIKIILILLILNLLNVLNVMKFMFYPFMVHINALFILTMEKLLYILSDASAQAVTLLIQFFPLSRFLIHPFLCQMHVTLFHPEN